MKHNVMMDVNQKKTYIMLKQLFEFIRITKQPFICGFYNIEDVFNSFAETYDEEKVIIYADYETPMYEGYASVYYYDKRTKKYYEVYGSHCSCYGLENQWNAEEIVFDELGNSTRFDYRKLLWNDEIKAYAKSLENNYKA